MKNGYIHKCGYTPCTRKRNYFGFTPGGCHVPIVSDIKLSFQLGWAMPLIKLQDVPETSWNHQPFPFVPRCCCMIPLDSEGMGPPTTLAVASWPPTDSNKHSASFHPKLLAFRSYAMPQFSHVTHGQSKGWFKVPWANRFCFDLFEDVGGQWLMIYLNDLQALCTIPGGYCWITAIFTHDIGWFTTRWIPCCTHGWYHMDHQP